MILLLGISAISGTKRVIWDEVISHERLAARVNTFNKWYSEFTGTNPKVEARLTTDPSWTRIGLFAKENLNAEEVYMTLDRSKLIRADLIYDTKIGQLLKVVEEEFGYDDYTNFLFYLLHEMNNKDSVWRPYLDLLPKQPTSIAFKYWDKKSWIEDELLHTPILSNIEKICFFKSPLPNLF
jgi:hypothetical protein